MKLTVSAIVVFIIVSLAFLLLSGCASLEKTASAYVAAAQSFPPAIAQEDATGTRVLADGWIETIPGKTGSIITQEDIDSLPEPVRRYFEWSLVVGKKRIGSFSVIIEGRIRNGANEEWMPLVMRQYNRIDRIARIVYIESAPKMMQGIDSYTEGTGRMHIKVANLITVADSKGSEMDVSALVTFMNDLILCPVAYLSLPVRWKEIDKNTAEMEFTNNNHTIRAVLTIDDKGQLLDWQSDDRYADVKGKNARDHWSTPIEGTQELAGLRIPSKGKGMHDYDGTPYAYVELQRLHSLVLDANALPPRVKK